MLIVAPVKESRRLPLPSNSEKWGIDLLNVPRSDIPAVTHLDYSARIQTVSRERTPQFHQLITEFFRLTGCPLLVNTSFNVRGEPIVCTPADAYRCFMRTHLDYLVIGSFVLSKKDQPQLDDQSPVTLD
jgi:carbamoyltransferase